METRIAQGYVSADGHVVEPADLWTTRLDTRFRECAPHLEERPDGDYFIVEHLMWGSDYPHTEGTFPYSQEQIMRDFVGIPETEVYQIVTDNAVRLYGVELDSNA